jgi:hypothetical protein
VAQVIRPNPACGATWRNDDFALDFPIHPSLTCRVAESAAVTNQ